MALEQSRDKPKRKSRSGHTSSRETNHQCDLARPISTPSTTDTAFRMVDLDNRTHRIASRRVATMHPWVEMRNAGRKLRIFSEFRAFFSLLRTRRTEKKIDSKIFAPLPFDPLVALLDSRSRSVNHPSLHRDSRPRRFFASFVISSFSFLRSFQPVILFHTHTHTHHFLFTSLFISQSRLITRTNTYTRTYARACIHPLCFDSVLVTGLCFNIVTIIICGNV